MKVAPEELTAREGKVLRFVVSRNEREPVKPAMCVVTLKWSDLPHTILQAKATLGSLEKKGLVTRGDDGFTATDSGRKTLATANLKKMWKRGPGPLPRLPD